MSGLRELLEALCREEATFDAVRVAFTKAAAGGSASRDELDDLLTSVRGRLGDEQVAVLRSAVDAAAADRTVILPDPDSSADPGRGVGPLGADDDDRTVVLPDPDARPAAGPDDDRTVVLPDPDAPTPPVFGAGPAGDTDAETDREASTHVNLRAGADDSATELNFRAGASEEQTVLNRFAAAPATTLPDPPADPNTGVGEDATVLNLGPNRTDEEDATVINPDARTERPPSAPVDEDATVVNVDNDATVINVDNDATVVNLDNDATVVSLDNDATAVNPDSGVGGFDILGEDAISAAAQAATGASWPTGYEAVEAAGGAAPVGQLAAGDVLKDRFVLESMLGEGGMGAVWKAKDKLKEEARDRNPYVAVKLLQGDFKEHPEAFIALQRETSKQQRLAHPNIATVYDFDRDGETVYMTMEVMQGQPLDVFLRKNVPEEGLTEEEAMPLIEDICSGLAYAHQAGLVHSDLKPGNAFLVNDPDRTLGRVKLLDFGIARASKTQGDEEGEATLFDPGQLGALTPTYATVEMFDGQDPDPRDDIYALGIIAYQLLSAKHPYAKKSAPKAMEAGLVPDPVEKLDKRQNRGLARGVAFRREDRTETVEQFLDDIRKKKSRVPMFAAAAAVLLVIVAAALYAPVVDYFNEQKREEIFAVMQVGDVDSIQQGLALAQALENPEQAQLVLEDERTRDVVIALMQAGEESGIREGLALIRDENLAALRLSVQNDQRAKDALAALIAGGDEQSINTGIALIRPFDPDWQRTVMDHPTAKEAVITLYTNKMYTGIDPVAGRFDYTSAQSHLETLETLYPDSAEVFQIRNDLNAHRVGELAKLSDRFNAALNASALLPSSAGDIGVVLAHLRQIDTEHSLLRDPRIASGYVEQIQAAMQADDYALAKQYVDASVSNQVADDTLADLNYQVGAELERRANQKLAGEIEERLADSWRGFGDLEAFQPIRPDLIMLARASPTSPRLAEIKQHLGAVFEREVDARLQASDWQDSEALLLEFSPLLEIAFVRATRARLTEAEGRAGYELQRGPAEQAAVRERVEHLTALLSTPELSVQWEADLRAPYHQFVASSAAVDADTMMTRVAELYLERARALRAENRFAEATELVDRGQVLSPAFAGFAAERQTIAEAAEALRRHQAEERRLARIADLKQSLLAKASADAPQEAKAILNDLSTELPPDDPFVTSEGPVAIGNAYLRLAQRMAEREDFDAARSLAGGGLAVTQELEPLDVAYQSYNRQLLESAAAMQVPGPADRGAVPTLGDLGDGSEFALDPPTIGGTPLTVRFEDPAASLVASPVLAPFGAPLKMQVNEANPALGSAVAQQTAARILRLAGDGDEGIDLAGLGLPLRTYAALYEDSYPALHQQAGERVAERIGALVDTAPLEVAMLAEKTDAYGALFPDHLSGLRDDLAQRHALGMKAKASAEPLDVQALRAPMHQFQSMYPEHHPQLREALAGLHLNGIVVAARDRSLAVTALDEPIVEFNALFSERSAELAGAVTDGLSERITGVVNRDPLSIARYAPALTAFGRMYPTAQAKLRAEIGARVGDRLVRSNVGSVEKVEALGPTLVQFEATFPQRYAQVSQSLADNIAKRIITLQAQDIYKADALQRAALNVFPDAGAITAIRLELPLEELINGRKELRAGRLDAAQALLTAAIERDPQHSQIDPFRQSLESKQGKAQRLYNKYVQLTMDRKLRNERKSMFANARKLWADNKLFVTVKEPRAGRCTDRLAGLGKDKRSVCFDMLSRKRKGPILVVVPPGQGFDTAFAIGKYEVTVGEYNLYCKSSKSCEQIKRKSKRWPATGVSLEAAKGYAEWLSARSSKIEEDTIVYRLPTEDEWHYAAVASGSQPARTNFNCRVTSSGQIIKGHDLVNADAGNPNDWGLTNYVGNAQEWVTREANVVVRGGAFTDDLAKCGLEMTRDHDGSSDPVTGFRLLREINS